MCAIGVAAIAAVVVAFMVLSKAETPTMQSGLVAAPRCSPATMARNVQVNAVAFGKGINERISKRDRRMRRKMVIRKKVEGTPDRPRLSVFRSNNHIYGQLIDDSIGHTVASA